MQNVVEAGARRTQPVQSLDTTAIVASIGEGLVAAFRDTLATCEDVLFGHAQNAHNGMRQAQFFDDLAQLRQGQARAVGAFSRACRKVLAGTPLDPPAHARHASDPLQLVADEDLEVDLAVFRIARRCDETTPRLRHQVERRLAVLLGLVDGEPAPLSGSVVAKSCRIALATIDFALESRLIVLKQFERRLPTALEGLLEATNVRLVGHGVLPNLRPTPVLPAAAATRTPTLAPEPAVRRTASIPDARQLGEMLGEVRAWIARRDQHADQSGTPAPSTPAETRAMPDIPAAATAMPADQGCEDARQRRCREISERRAAEIDVARERRQLAARSADGVVAAVLSQAHVPADIRDAVGGPLRRHLETIHARRGAGSTEWRTACKLVRDIAWALDPDTADSETAHWRAMVPGIVAALRSALLAAGVDEDEIDRIVAEFGVRYEGMLHAREAPAPAPAIDADAPLAPPAAVAAPSPCAADFGDALRRVRQLAVGRWYELQDDLGQIQRAKLVWTSAMTERCLFVNGHGKLVADRPHARVATDLLCNQFRELGDQSLSA